MYSEVQTHMHQGNFNRFFESPVISVFLLESKIGLKTMTLA